MVYGSGAFELAALRVPEAVRRRVRDRLKHVGEEGATPADMVGVANMLVTWQEIDAELVRHRDCPVIVLHRLAPLTRDGFREMGFWDLPRRPLVVLVHMSPFGLRQAIIDGRITCVIQGNFATVLPGTKFFKKDLDTVFDMQYLMITKANVGEPNYAGFLGEMNEEANQ
jgi:hypothetical protein